MLKNHLIKLKKVMQRASKLSLLHTDWVICVYDATAPYYVISSTLPDLNNKPNNFVCCFYEHGVNLIELTYCSRYDELIVDFCNHLDRASQLHLKIWLSVQFLKLHGYSESESKNLNEDYHELYREICCNQEFSLKKYDVTAYLRFIESIIDTVLKDDTTVEYYLSDYLSKRELNAVSA